MQVSSTSFPDLMQIKNNANRAAGLVGQLLTFSRKQPSRIQTISMHDAFVDLSGLLERTIAPFVTLKTNFKRNLGCIKMDKNQLTQTEQWKFMKHYKQELLEYNPDIVVICISASAFPSVFDDFYKD